MSFGGQIFYYDKLPPKLRQHVRNLALPIDGDYVMSLYSRNGSTRLTIDLLNRLEQDTVAALQKTIKDKVPLAFPTDVPPLRVNEETDAQHLAKCRKKYQKRKASRRLGVAFSLGFYFLWLHGLAVVWALS